MQFITNQKFLDALLRTGKNIAISGVCAVASMFASRILKAQAVATINSAQSDYLTIRDLAKGI